MALADEGFDSPEAAARGDIPDRYCSVIASVVDGDLAQVLIATNEPSRSYHLQVICRRAGDRWREDSFSSGAEGSCWFPDAPESGTGALAWSRAAPVGADRLRYHIKGVVREAAVQNGYCLGIERQIAGADEATIHVSEWRRSGEWS